MEQVSLRFSSGSEQRSEADKNALVNLQLGTRFKHAVIHTMINLSTSNLAESRHITVLSERLFVEVQ